jgi:hypothetical protein
MFGGRSDVTQAFFAKIFGAYYFDQQKFQRRPALFELI